jgi:gamma-glutamyltranspeptidase/glutathione hydrolase
MVCSGHPLASEAGLHVLRQGGNAVDAAIATGAALGVVEPASSGIGGDGFIMVRWAETGAVHVINATGAAPAGATVEAYAATGIPMKGIRSVSVPGILDGWLTAHDRFGTLSRNDVSAPAIELAEDGFPVSALLAREIAADESLRTFLSSRAIFMRDGRPLSMGETLFQRDLAMTYRAVADGGADVFYRGALAKAITACSVHYSGLLGNEDLAQYRATWQQAIATTYHGYDVYESPPNSSGHVLLQELNMVECFDFQGENIDSVGGIHVMVEAKKLAFADRERYMADPAFVDVPLAGLLSKSYAAERAKSIRMDVACTTVESGDPWPFEGRAAPTQSRVRRSSPTRQETTCLCVVDRWGNAVNILQSVQGGFGSGLVVEGTGILLNNRMTYWHLDPDHVDCLEPGKRVRHTMNTVMACKDGKLALVLGTPGADTQVQTNLQLLTHMLDAGYNPVEAVEAPRWRHLQNGTESTIPHDCDDELRLESRFPDGVVDELARLGHPVTRIGAWEAMGSAMVIQVIKPDGALAGAADPRKDGYALGW